MHVHYCTYIRIPWCLTAAGAERGREDSDNGIEPRDVAESLRHSLNRHWFPAAREVFAVLNAFIGGGVC